MDGPRDMGATAAAAAQDPHVRRVLDRYLAHEIGWRDAAFELGLGADYYALRDLMGAAGLKMPIPARIERR